MSALAGSLVHLAQTTKNINYCTYSKSTHQGSLPTAEWKQDNEILE